MISVQHNINCIIVTTVLLVMHCFYYCISPVPFSYEFSFFFLGGGGDKAQDMLLWSTDS